MAQETDSARPAVPPTEEESAQPSVRPEGLERVREIILGPERIQERLRQVEASRLREIIFGVQMEDYERRFADLRRQIERVVNDLRQVQDSLSEFQRNQIVRIESLERETRRANEELRREVDRLRTQEPLLQQVLTQTRQQQILSQGLSEDTGEFRKALAQYEQDVQDLHINLGEHRDQHERRLDALKHEVRKAEDDLRAELRRVADRLDDQKTDRRALAAMLAEVATRLETGSSVTGLLEGLTSLPKE